MHRVNAAFQSATNVEQLVLRLDIGRSIREEVQQSGLSYEEVEEVFRLLGHDIVEQDDVIRRIFRPNANGKFRVRRYGAGDHPVLYCSTEQDTAIAEMTHYLEKDPWMNTRSEFRDVFKIELLGLCAELRGLGIDELTDEDYSFCQEVGALASQSDVSFFFCPSARSDGTNCPVFKEPSIRSIDRAARLELSRDSDTTAIVVKEV